MSAGRAGITVAIALVVLSPLARGKGWGDRRGDDKRGDDFPLSTYPMFARGDMTGAQPLAQALVVLADGHRRPAKPAEIGTPEPTVANTSTMRAILEGHADDLCAVVARNVAEPDAVSVEVVISEYDARKYFVEGRREPESRVVHAWCAVPR